MNGTHQQATRVNILVWVFAVIKLCTSKHCPSLPTVQQKRENTTDTPSVWKSILTQGRLDAHMHLVDSLIHSFLNLLLVRSQRRTGGENTESTKCLRLCLYKPHRVVRNVSVILLLPPHWNLLYKMLYKRCNMLMKGTPFGSIHHLDEE